jgi:hypothetical protein
MKFISVLAFLFVGSLQGQQIRSATWSTDTFLLKYRTMVEPARPRGQELHIGGGGFDDSVTNHRVLEDLDQKKYFGYNLQVGVIGGGRFQLNFKPLTVESWMRFNLDGWSEIPLPSVPTTMQLNDGETVALDLMVNPTTGEKIVEYITVGSPTGSGGAARDFQMNDVQMMLASPQLHLNGKSMEWNHGDSHGVASGSVVWVYVPDRGRFLISFAPHAELGFRQAGEARGAQIKFAWNGETYELRGTERIMPADGAWNVYVYQDRGYQPAYPPALYGASDKPESLLHR